jgi:hypothetical protein
VSLTITPGTSGTLTITLEYTDSQGVAQRITSAAVSATVRNPELKRLEQNVTMSNAGNGNYTLPIDPAWSLTNGVPAVGTYYVDVTVLWNGEQLFDRLPYLVAL